MSVFLSLALCVGLAQAIEVTEEAGGNQTDVSGTDAYKMNTYEVSALTELAYFEVYLGSGQGDRIDFVVYENVGGDTWDLIYSSGLTSMTNGTNWKSSPDIGIDLEPGKVYSLG